MRLLAAAAVVAAALALLLVLGLRGGDDTGPWTPAQLDVLRSLALTDDWQPGPDRSNRYADDPEAAALGHALFFESRLSANGRVSCATCHQPRRGFQGGRALRCA